MVSVFPAANNPALLSSVEQKTGSHEYLMRFKALKTWGGNTVTNKKMEEDVGFLREFLVLHPGKKCSANFESRWKKQNAAKLVSSFPSTMT